MYIVVFVGSENCIAIYIYIYIYIYMATIFRPNKYNYIHWPSGATLYPTELKRPVVDHAYIYIYIYMCLVLVVISSEIDSTIALRF